MKGQFAFILEGYTADGFLAAIGSFTADGKGKITAGYVDANSENTSGNGVGSKSGAVTAIGSSYSIGSDDRGCATIVTPFYTFRKRFAIGPSTSGTTQGRMIEFEPWPAYLVAAGQIFQQQVPTAVPAGKWVHAQFGAIDIVNYESPLMASGVDVYAAGGTITDGEYEYTGSRGTGSQSSVTGSYTSPDATTGRFTLTTTDTLGILGAKSLDRTAYLVSPTRIIEITTSANTILVGEVKLQSGALTLSGTLATYGSEPAGAVAGFGRMNATGSGYTANIYLDNSGGTWAKPTPVPTTCSYTIDSLGRVATSGSNCGSNYGYAAGSSTLTWTTPPIIYLTGPNTGVAQGGAGLWEIKPQTATSIKLGKYYYGTQFAWVGVYNSAKTYEATSGVADITSGITLTATEDAIMNGEEAGATSSETLTLNSDGTFSSSNNPGIAVGLVISNTQGVSIEHVNSVPRLLIFNTIP